jgi:ribosomal protein L11 methyltransferase
MKWIRFTIDTHVDAVDLLSYMLDEIGVEGIEIEDHLPLSEEDKKKMFVDILPDPVENDNTAKVHFYMEPDHCQPEKIMIQVQNILNEIKEFCEIGKGTVSLSETEDKDWINNWKAFFKPFRAAEDIVIKPTWEDYKKEKESDILIEIDPGIAFGTGSHETTKLCIQALDKYVKSGDSVLDVGCGSGILSIAALKLGACHATAIDIDEVAVKVAAENMEVNHLPQEQYTLYAGDLITDSALKEKAGANHDIVVANILADVIIPLTGVISPHMKKGGLYITSGIIDTKEEDVKTALLNNGFEILEISHMKEWCCFIVKL